MALPFDLPNVSRGYALLTPGARAIGRRATAEAARALSTLAGCEVTVTGRPLPGIPTPCAGVGRLRIELAALPGTAVVEVEAPLAVALLDLLCGGQGAVSPAASVTPLEQAAVELAALAALAALASIPEVEGRLAPRLARQAGEPVGGLAIDLAIALGAGAGAGAGRARIVLPPAAVKVLGDECAQGQSPAAIGLVLSIRGGAAPLLPEEVEALAPGDVVLLDPLPAGRLTAVAPGGLRVVGAESEDGLQIQEIQMPEANRFEWPIAVEVELARVPITLGDLARLEPGAILPLPIDRSGRVALKLGDRTVARGQLVDVEGSVGVRIDSVVEGP